MVQDDKLWQRCILRTSRAVGPSVSAIKQETDVAVPKGAILLCLLVLI